MKQFILSILIFISLQTYAQCKTYLLSTKGDTVNCTDFYNHKQGKWLINGAPLRGEPGFTEEGLFKDDKKEGEWQRFNLMGDVIADENYKWGFKNGLSSYYNLIGLLRTESWKSIDPKNPYDTVNVYGLSDRPDTVFTRLMKVDATAVRHGTWTYYNPERGTIDRTEEYIFDQLVVNKPKQNVADSLAINMSAQDSLTLAEKQKPLEVLEFEKKNKKKKIEVRDGETGVN